MTSSAGTPARRRRSIRFTPTRSTTNFRSGIWASFDATYLNGGRTTINDGRSQDLQQNWRLGGTLTIPVDVRNSIKLYASSGVSARTGNDYDLLGIAWQHRWGAGL